MEELFTSCLENTNFNSNFTVDFRNIEIRPKYFTIPFLLWEKGTILVLLFVDTFFLLLKNKFGPPKSGALLFLMNKTILRKTDSIFSENHSYKSMTWSKSILLMEKTAGTSVNFNNANLIDNPMFLWVAYFCADIEPLQNNPDLEEGFCKALLCRLRFRKVLLCVVISIEFCHRSSCLFIFIIWRKCYQIKLCSTAPTSNCKSFCWYIPPLIKEKRSEA